MSLIMIGTFASLCAGLATALGALPVFFVRSVSEVFLDASLGFAAGVMLAATSFSLIIPAIEAGGLVPAVAGIALGAVFVYYAERLTPHLHLVKGQEGPRHVHLSKILLFVLAVTIHNFPEGMAVGVGFGSGDIKAGTALAVGIGLQNIPEGLAVALPLLRLNVGRLKAFGIALLTGLVEPIGGILGISVISLGSFLLPYGLAFAAGAMLLVISEEIIPETHSKGNDRQASVGLITGFIVMMVLDTMFA